MSDWPGPLFYPPVGSIAIMQSGARIEVWPDESGPGRFTGVLLPDRVDCSCMWDRSRIAHIEERLP